MQAKWTEKKLGSAGKTAIKLVPENEEDRKNLERFFKNKPKDKIFTLRGSHVTRDFSDGIYLLFI